jgi:hypothetical protein
MDEPGSPDGRRTTVGGHMGGDPSAIHRTSVRFAAAEMNGARYFPTLPRNWAQRARDSRRSRRKPIAKGDPSMGARDTTTQNLQTVGATTLRFGLVLNLLLIGRLKFEDYEVDNIRPMIV